MLEAVNSVLQTSSLVRASAEQASSVDSFAANPERVQRVAQAPYISPYVHVDNNYNKAVLQIRDSDTGDVLNQFPSEERLRTIAQQSTVQVSEGAPERSEDSALADVQRTSGQSDDSRVSSAATGAAGSVSGGASSAGVNAQQIAAFQAAAVSGAPESGGVEVFA